MPRSISFVSAFLPGLLLSMPCFLAGAIITEVECSATQREVSGPVTQTTVTDANSCSIIATNTATDGLVAASHQVIAAGNDITSAISMTALPGHGVLPGDESAIAATSNIAVSGTTAGPSRLGFLQFWFEGSDSGGIGAAMVSQISFTDAGAIWDFEWVAGANGGPYCTNPFNVPNIPPCAGLLPATLGGTWNLSIYTQVSASSLSGSVMAPANSTISFRLFEQDARTPVDFLISPASSEVPEPATGGMLLIGIISLGWLASSRKSLP